MKVFIGTIFIYFYAIHVLYTIQRLKKKNTNHNLKIPLNVINAIKVSNIALRNKKVLK